MKLKNVLLAVNDLEASVRFYETLFGLDVILRRDGNVILTEGLVLQDRSLWESEIGMDCISKNHMSELYFEETRMEQFLEKLRNYERPVEYVTNLKTLPGGQMIVRLYDPDGNLIEVRSVIR